MTNVIAKPGGATLITGSRGPLALLPRTRSPSPAFADLHDRHLRHALPPSHALFGVAAMVTVMVVEGMPAGAEGGTIPMLVLPVGGDGPQLPVVGHPEDHGAQPHRGRPEGPGPGLAIDLSISRRPSHPAPVLDVRDKA
jgi:hypothetical protein